MGREWAATEQPGDRAVEVLSRVEWGALDGVTEVLAEQPGAPESEGLCDQLGDEVDALEPPPSQAPLGASSGVRRFCPARAPGRDLSSASPTPKD